jgi:acyl-CoA synthetase (AMP-forming)/AMP-acid ligase II
MSLLGPIFEQDPDAIAFRAGDDSVTYGQLCRDIDTMAFWLKDKGVGEGTRLGIHFKGDQSYWTLIAHVGSMRVGACHTTVGNDQGLQAAIEHGLEAYLVARSTPPDVAEKVRTFWLFPTTLKPLAEQLGVEQRAWEDVEAEKHAARLAFTSGTTGVAQPLLWTPDIFARRVAQVRDHVTQDTKLFLGLGLLTTAGIRYPVGLWQAGGTLMRRGIDDEVKNPAYKIIRSSNLVATSPATLGGMINRNPQVWPGRDSRTIIVMGGRLPLGVRARALALACARLEINYGATEVGRVAIGDSALLDRHPGAVGFVTDEAVIEIVDEQDRPVAAGVTGIVRIKSPAMGHGYEKPVGKSAKAPRDTSAFRDGWFYPGDLGILFDDGLFAVAGRTNETANLGGVKVSIADVETKVAQIAGVEDLAIVAIETRIGDRLAIVTVFAADADRAAIEAQMKELLPGGTKFQIIGAQKIPRNAMGKVEREVLGKRVKNLLGRPQLKRRARGAPQPAG